MDLGDDPELLALPSPPKRERTATIVVMTVTALATIALGWSLRGEARYAVSAGQPTELGDLSQLTPSPDLANRYVRGSALLGASGAIRYGRAAEGDSFRLAPVAGNEKLWVEIRVPEGFEGPRFIPPSSFAGRLVPMSDAGLRHAMLPGEVRDKAKTDIAADAWILIDSTSPRASRWALLLVALLTGFAAWNVLGIARLLGRVRDGSSGAGPGSPPDDDLDEPIGSSAGPSGAGPSGAGPKSVRATESERSAST
jgi:hypothetical protein